jgi:hypothetical protein
MLAPKLRAHRLKSPKLRKIRTSLRSIILLEYKKKELELREKMSFAFGSQQGAKLFKEREDLKLALLQSPINCFYCGDHKGDLVQDPDSLLWFCPHHMP